MLRFAGGARGTLQSSRASVGDQCTYGVEVHGQRGALAWDFRRMGELPTRLDQDYQNASYATQFVATGSGDLAHFQPGSDIAMSYDDLKVIEAQRLITSIATGQPVGATITDARRAAEIVDARAASARDRCWVSTPSLPRSAPTPSPRPVTSVTTHRRNECGSDGSADK